MLLDYIFFLTPKILFLQSDKSFCVFITSCSVIFYALPIFTTAFWFRKFCAIFAITIEANPCEVIMFSTILTTFFFHKLPRFRKIQCADLNGLNLPTRNTGTLKGKMQLLAIAICQIETTGIEPASHDIQYHCSTTELCFISRLSRTVLFKRTGMGFTFVSFNSNTIVSFRIDCVFHSFNRIVSKIL